MKHMIHMMNMMRVMDMMTSECLIICSSNHIDTAPGLSPPKAKGICRPLTFWEFPAIGILIRSCLEWVVPQLGLFLVLVGLPW